MSKPIATIDRIRAHISKPNTVNKQPNRKQYNFGIQFEMHSLIDKIGLREQRFFILGRVVAFANAISLLNTLD